MYEDIKNSVRITDVLRKYGFHAFDRESYRIPCPIHRGNDANFSVSERENLWNCFSVCGRGGSVIDLVAALEDISIPEAVKKLREEYRLTPVQSSLAAARKTVSQVERYKEMQKYPSEIQLPDTIELEEGYRGFTRKTIEHWGLRRVPPPPIDVHTVPGGVLIPLVNVHGGVCSYSIRKDEGEPKYWNAPGVSKCYPFGLYSNARDIVQEGFAWLVEGQMDAISLWQKGYKNVIALMGSSMTEQQAMLILAVTSNLMLCMDGDEPGRKAAAKIKKQWQSVFDIGIFELPDNTDPDEYNGILER